MVEPHQTPLEDGIPMRKIPFKILLAQQLFLAHLRLCSLQTPSKADIISLKMSHSARVSPYSIRCRRKVL